MKRLDEEVIRRAMMAIRYVCDMKKASDTSDTDGEDYCDNCPAVIMCKNGWKFEEPSGWCIRGVHGGGCDG